MIKAWAAIFLLACSCATARAASSGVAPKPNITVAVDGSGDVRTVQAAVDRVPENNAQRFIIAIKPGTYQEQIKIPASKPYISFIGTEAEKTVLTFNLTNKATGSTSASYSFYVGGHDFYAENITFANSFGIGSQAVAVLAEADRVVFKKCRFIGWQDTLYAKGGRQYYEDCYIEGHVDFIFGAATAVFQNCVIHSKGAGFIAAPMRFSDAETTGFVFRKCRLTGADTGAGVYLGRPWRAYGRTVYLQTEMAAHIRPEGWENWRDPAREKTAYFAEYQSTGPGANPTARVKWAHQLTAAEAQQFAPENFLKGADGWQPTKANFAWQSTHPPQFKLVTWADALKQPTDWYPTDEATRIADNVLLYQRANGGWPKNIDMAAMLTQAEKNTVAQAKNNTETTFDNGATSTQLRYLAKLVTAKNIDRHKAAFFAGLDFTLSAQYPNGGFPQFFPLQKDYSRHITYNDNAMLNVLKLLRDIAAQKPDFAFVDEPRRTASARAVEQGIKCLLATQVVVNGQKTVWCAQHDAVTLAPTNARKYELASLSGSESAGLVQFLMDIKQPAPEVREAVESAVAWFRKSQLNGIRWTNERTTNGQENHVVKKDPQAPPLWARFYDIATNRPIFVGRDGVIHYDVAEIEPERRNGYRWYVDEPNKLLKESYPKWQQQNSGQ